MVRSSTASCFKLITCAGGGNDDSVDRDDLGAPPESKGSSDRNRWSFRKRSARHRVLSNSVTLEMPYGNKTSPDSAAVSFQTQASSTIAEKNSLVQWAEEKNQMQIPADSKLSQSVTSVEDENRADSTPDEAVVIIIQSAIRRFLAQRVLLKHKNIIKLQATVRGHIVRRHAVGSLRCVKAIAKMQVLVRERRARLLLKGSSIEEKFDDMENDNHSSLTMNENPGIKPYACTSSEKLLNNAFARQLLESTPKNKTINIKCDPSKSDSAWQWLERWMSVSLVENKESKKLGLAREEQDDINIVEADFHLQTAISSPENCQSTDAKTSIEALAEVSEANDNVTTYDAGSYNFQEYRPTLSRKACNPAFIAAQSKFEELSSAASVGKSVSSSNKDAGLNSSSDAVLPVINHAESSFSQSFGIQVGGSECGTELSISSTLDSPDRSEVGVVDFEKETKSLENENDAENPKSSINLEFDKKVESKPLERDLSFSNSSQPEIHESSTAANFEHVSSMVAADSSQVVQTPDSPTVDVHNEMKYETSHSVSKSSPGASPRSRVTIPESSQGTPSSQVSVKPNKIRNEKRVTNHKHGSVSIGKESHVEPDQDNSARSSEHLSKEHKTGKRHNSFGSDKPDHGDQEPRDSRSSNSLPSYMQATESARAKALANSSPRSSPDVQDKDLHIKKRHSLPGTNTRQGSPRVQRSMSVTQQDAKGNGTHSPQERKWRR